MVRIPFGSALQICVLGSTIVRCAMDMKGERIINPLGVDDPAPIADPTAYSVELHDCPLPCIDYANIHSWIPFLSVDRLQRCSKPMLLQFSVTARLNDSKTDNLIRACTLDTSSADARTFASLPNVANAKADKRLFQTPSERSKACKLTGSMHERKLRLLTGGPKEAAIPDVVHLLAGARAYFSNKANCDESFVFAYHNKLVVGVHVGKQFGKSTAKSVLTVLADRLEAMDGVPDTTILQMCDSEQRLEYGLGLSINNRRDLASIQSHVLAWSQGECPQIAGVQSIATISNVAVWDLASGNNNALWANRTLNDTLINNNASQASRKAQVQVSKPAPGQDGVCATHLILNGDTCWAIAARYGLTVAEIESFNTQKTWAWTDCSGLLVGYNMCLSQGLPPMPPPQQGTECGPIVPGTARPSDNSKPLSSLNPCPLLACCSNWGFCGVFPSHCTVNAFPGGGPGSKAKGAQNTCISNCETGLKFNSGPAPNFGRVGYFSAFAWERECLKLPAKDANTDGSYTHIHWAFAEINPTDWTVKINDPGKQWNDFKSLRNVKRIVSFGGWAYSTEPATYKVNSCIHTESNKRSCKVATIAISKEKLALS